MRNIVCLFALLIITACSTTEESTHTSLPVVKVIQTEKKEFPIYLESRGIVEPSTTVNITSRVTGEITGVYFKEGDTIKEGDLLFTIDPRSSQARVKETKGIIEEKLSQLKLAQEKVERYRALTQEEYYSKLDFDTLISNVNVLKASIKQAEAQLDNATTSLSYCWIYAPINGKTGILQVNEGNVVQGWEGDTLVSIHQIDPIYVHFTLPEKEIYLIRKKMREEVLETKISFDHFKTTHFSGKLEMIDNQVENGHIIARALFANSKEELWPHQTVDVRLMVDMKKNVIAIPSSALLITSSGEYVYVIDEGNKAILTKVDVGTKAGSLVEITNGLKEGQEVIIEKAGSIRPNEKVQVTF